MTIPGFAGGDLSTAWLRAQLGALGHPVHRWRLGRNEGPTPDLMDALLGRFDQLVERHERPVALVGWSLGGVYACSIARRRPDEVRAVVTLGSPLAGSGAIADPLRPPVTSVWSRNDRIVGPERARIEPGPRRENVEVRSTHLTLGFDPLVVAVIADRLVQDPDDWHRFEPPPWLRRALPGPRDGRG